MNSIVVLVCLFLFFFGVAVTVGYLYREKQKLQKLSHVKDADRKNQ
ncbi:pilus assembly protein TadG-related protein [Aeromonas aquatilis]